MTEETQTAENPPQPETAPQTPPAGTARADTAAIIPFVARKKNAAVAMDDWAEGPEAA